MAKSKKLNYVIVALLCIGIFFFVLKEVTECFASTRSTIRADGVLIEPYFFLIPIAYFFFISGILLALYKFMSMGTQSRRISMSPSKKEQ